MKKVFEYEMERNEVTPARFLGYVRENCKKRGIDFDMSMEEFKRDDWSCQYFHGTPETRPCEAELIRDHPYDKQTYIHCFDGSVYNMICEFTFDSERTGHGYFYTIQTEPEVEA